METSQTKLKLRVIIKLKLGNSLNKEFWSSFYQFIKSAEENDLTQDIVVNLSKFAIILISTSQQRIGKKNICDVDNEHDFPFTLDTFKRYDKDLYNLCYSIIYHKSENHDDLEIDQDVTEIIPFFLLNKYYNGLLTLGIKPFRDPENPEGFYYKCRGFFKEIYSEPANLICGKNYVYFITEDPKSRTKALIVKEDSSDSGSTESRWFFPIFEINEDRYNQIFLNKISGNSNDPIIQYIYESLGKIQRGNDTAVSDSNNTDKSSLFEKWFEAAYRYSSKENENLPEKEYEDYKRTLAIYKRSIFELVQNIKFHAIGSSNEKGWGYIYCIFDKTKNLSQEHKDNLPKFEENKNRYEENGFRFLKVGIYDFGERGIIETFKNDNPKYVASELTLKDFFSQSPLDLKELSLLEARASAKLGIKTFVSTLTRYNGYFRVETNNNGVKIEISTKKEGSKDELSEQKSLKNINGTHYEIILPVSKTEKGKDSPPLPSSGKENISNISNFIASPIITINSADIETEFGKIIEATTKDDQIAAIESTTKLIQEKLGENKPDSFSIDCRTIEQNKGVSVFTTAIFKIIASLQHTHNDSKGYKKIILFNLTETSVNGIFEEIKGILNLSSTKWSNENAVILMSENLYCKIICGKDEETMEYLNQELEKVYPHIKNDNKKHKKTDTTTTIDNKTKEKIARDFILLHEAYIKDAMGEPCFNTLFKQDLYRNIISDENKIGFRVDHQYTDILNQVIVKDYYETDLMFQNSFYVERFAISIAINLYNRYKDITDLKLILIGYKNYSELLLNRLKNNLESVFTNIIIKIVLADDNTIEEKEKEKEKRNRINFVAQDNDFRELLQSIQRESEKENSRKEEYLKNHRCAIIVPIGSTLRTNDKIVSFWKQKIIELKAEDPKDIYNHCIIVARDKIDSTPTNLEKQFKWSNVEDKEQLITTNFENAKEIYYTIQIAKVEDDKNNGEGNWLHKLNAKVSFKEEYWDEEYVNPTKDSINSSYIMTSPGDDITEIEEEQHLSEINRLLALKEFCHSGHIEAFDTHHRYYIDTEAFVRGNNTTYKNWLSSIKFDSFKTHILITPEPKIESKFVNDINYYVFKGQALIIKLDLKDRIENTIAKLSFLKKMQDKEAQYHFVDHVLHSGDTFWRTSSFLKGHLERKFSSVFSLINRMGQKKTTEIKCIISSSKMFTFLTLNYPAIKQKGRMCYLCDLKRYHKDIRDNSVSTACRQAFTESLEKNEVKHFRSKGEDKQNEEKRKYRFYRLVLTHEILFNIKKKSQISQVLNTIYDELIELSGKNISEKEENLFSSQEESGESELRKSLKKLFENLKMDEYDAKISFIKALSSPPLSSYVVIRKYAHEKLLKIVKEILDYNSPKGNDLKLLKASLKCLSYLKSNALIRKDVIIGAWGLVSKIKEIQSKDVEKFGRDFLFYIKYSIFSDEIKAYFLGELLRTGEEVEIKNDVPSMTISSTKPDKDNTLLKIFDDKPIKDEYHNFLENLFYENTTILRKTLNNFVFEIKKNVDLNEILRIQPIDFIKELSDNNQSKKFQQALDLAQKEESHVKKRQDFITLFEQAWNKIDANQRLSSIFGINELRDKVKSETSNSDVISVLRTKFNSFHLKKFNSIELYKIKEYFNDLINKEYYYSYFIPYSKNTGDNIDYLEKLICAAYAQYKLEIKTKDIEEATRELMQVFASIMGADAAFLSSKTENSNGEYDKYIISIFGPDNFEKKWKDEERSLNDQYQTSRTLESNSTLPIHLFYNLDDKYKEKKDFGAKSLVVYQISNTQSNTSNTQLSAISFLFYENNPILTKDEDYFIVRVREYGRILLLLKNSINQYFKSLYENKVLNLWVESKKIEWDRKKIYRNQSHNAGKHLNKVIEAIVSNNINNINPYLFAICSNLAIGNIYYAIMVGEPLSPELEYVTLDKIIDDKFISAADQFLSNEKNSTLQIINKQQLSEYRIPQTSDFKSTFILFQLICGSIKHIDDNTCITIQIEDSYLSFASISTKCYTTDELNKLRNRIYSHKEPKESISLHCINRYFYWLKKVYCEDDIDIKQICIDFNKNTKVFEVKIPINKK